MTRKGVKGFDNSTGDNGLPHFFRVRITKTSKDSWDVKGYGGKQSSVARMLAYLLTSLAMNDVFCKIRKKWLTSATRQYSFCFPLLFSERFSLHFLLSCGGRHRPIPSSCNIYIYIYVWHHHNYEDFLTAYLSH